MNEHDKNNGDDHNGAPFEELRGLVIVNTGPGKGKTTAALGASLRAVGRGLRVLVVQFVKNMDTGELRAAEHLPGLVIRQMGRGRIMGREPGEKHRLAAREAWDFASRAVESGEYGLVVLDEIFAAMKYGFVEIGEVLGLLRNRPQTLHLILTGRNCPAEIMDQADTVTVMEAVKHHLHSGITSQAGIEY